MRERASRLPFSVISINPAAQAPLYRQLYDEMTLIRNISL